jgi:hypothetical protein
MSPVMREYAAARQYRPLYERLMARGAARTAQETYFLSRIFERCRTGVRSNLSRDEVKSRNDEKRRQLEVTLSPKDPTRAARLAAFDRMREDPCEGLSDLPEAFKEARGLVESAAAAGNPAAQARLVRYQLTDQLLLPDGSMLAPSRPDEYSVISDAQLDVLRRSVGSHDPYALMTAMEALEQPLANFSLRTDDGRSLQMDAMRTATRLVACDLGYPCGNDDRDIAATCAFLGKCDAADYRDWIFFYARSPADSQAAQDYYVRLSRAATSGDWSGFSFSATSDPRWSSFPVH